MKKWIFFLHLSSGLLIGAFWQKPMVIIVPSYNNKEIVEWNLTSIFLQDYQNYRIIYIDDHSMDGTGEAVLEMVKKHKQEKRFQYIYNDERSGAMANIYAAVHSCQNHEIIVLVDGDDALARLDVLTELNKIYSAKKVWYTHGCLMEYPSGNVTWCKPIPEEVIQNNSYRQFKCPSHLRTFYAWIFKKILLHDFLHEGKFLLMAWDMAIMFPIAEMAAERHAFISEVNYYYNMANPYNDNKVDPDLQNQLDTLVRNRTPYQRLKKADR